MAEIRNFYKFTSWTWSEHRVRFGKLCVILEISRTGTVSPVFDWQAGTFWFTWLITLEVSAWLPIFFLYSNYSIHSYHFVIKKRYSYTSCLLNTFVDNISFFMNHAIKDIKRWLNANYADHWEVTDYLIMKFVNSLDTRQNALLAEHIWVYYIFRTVTPGTRD